MPSKNRSKLAPLPGARTNGIPAWMRVLHLVADTFARLVDRVGWPGALMLLVFFFVQYNGTSDQKQKIIDKFVLGIGQDMVYPYCAIVVVVVIVFVGQNHYWRKRNENLNSEVERLSKWKSDHQLNAIPGGLHHTETKRTGL